MFHSNSPKIPEARRSGQLSPAAYSVLLVLLPLFAITAMIALGRSNFFLRHGASVWVQANDSIFAMHDRRCDVLIFGDSTAMTGIDPEQVQVATGLRTCNIAVTNAVLAVTENLPLDHFLAHNTRPQVLLVQLSPEDLERDNHVWTRTIYAEGLLELLRHGSGAEIRRVLWQHPSETIAFAGYVAGYSAYYGLRSLWAHVARTPIEEERIIIRNGFFTPPMAQRTSCEPADHRVDVEDRAFPLSFVEGLRGRYREKAGVVLVNVAPIPACDENLGAYRTQLTGVTSNELRGLPIELFNDERHYTAAGARNLSAEIAAEIKTVHLAVH